MTTNCFKMEKKKKTLEKGLRERHKKLFYNFTDKAILNVLKAIGDDSKEYREGIYSVQYDGDCKNINFFIYNESNTKKDIFANISITPKGLKCLYYLENSTFKLRDDFLETFTIDKLKKQIERQYKKTNEKKQLKSDRNLGFY